MWLTKGDDDFLALLEHEETKGSFMSELNKKNAVGLSSESKVDVSNGFWR